MICILTVLKKQSHSVHKQNPVLQLLSKCFLFEQDVHVTERVLVFCQQIARGTWNQKGTTIHTIDLLLEHEQDVHVTERVFLGRIDLIIKVLLL